MGGPRICPKGRVESSPTGRGSKPEALTKVTDCWKGGERIFRRAGVLVWGLLKKIWKPWLSMEKNMKILGAV